MIETMDSALLQRDCRWWVASGLLTKLMRVNDRSGRPLLKVPPKTDGFYLLGFPVVLTPAAPAVNLPGRKVMAFGDPRGYAVALRNWFNFDSSNQANWNQLQRSFRGYGRAKGVLRNSRSFATLKLAAV